MARAYMRRHHIVHGHYSFQLPDLAGARRALPDLAGARRALRGPDDASDDEER